ncbi:MAG: aldehyde dehydrogenase family protein, partial [Flammeovirgaceae bacterium]|nr:aldehyde dehydrogenase family protein [Flammeovirgaceae bacterium]
MANSTNEISVMLKNLGVEASNPGAAIGAKWLPTRGQKITSFSPADGKAIAEVTLADEDAYEKVINAASEAYKTWRLKPAPQRGEIVRQIGEELRKHKDDL